MNNAPFNGIPQTKEEMENIRSQVGQMDSKALLSKAQKINTNIELCKRMTRMFGTDEFKEFWRLVHDDVEKMTDGGVRAIKGHITDYQRYDPLGQLAQLNIIQGGLEVLESQAMTKEAIEQKSKKPEIDTTELEEKLKVINS